MWKPGKPVLGACECPFCMCVWQHSMESYVKMQLFEQFTFHHESAHLFIPQTDMADFREVFAKAKHIAIITGAGVSAESGVPTFRGAGGFWRKWQAQVCTMALLCSSVSQGCV